MLRASRSLPANLRNPSRRSITSSSVRSSEGGSTHYNQPSGYLFGEKPPAPGQKRKREDWEMLWYIGMFGSMAVAAVGLYYKPDTTIQTWALKEARERLEARGEAFEYKPPAGSPSPPEGSP